VKPEAAQAASLLNAIDSLSGFDMALASMCREDFRESLYRLAATLTDMGHGSDDCGTGDRYTMLSFSSYGNALLGDAIVMQRYVALEGQRKRVLSVVKVRGSEHSKDIRFYDITSAGFMLGDSMQEYQSVLSAQPFKS